MKINMKTNQKMTAAAENLIKIIKMCIQEPHSSTIQPNDDDYD
jgi:hypothetical protein